MTKTGIVDAQLALDIVRSDKNAIAYDTETTGLEHSDYIVGYVVTNSDFSVYVPVRHGDGGNIPDVDDFEDALADAFASRSRRGFRTVGHHLGFDLRMSAKVGYGGKKVAILPWSPLEDTMINEALIDDNTIGYSLDDCARRHGVTPKLGDSLYRAIAERFGGLPDRSSMKHYWKMPGDHPEVLEYSTGDGVSTLELWAIQQALLDEKDGYGDDLRKPWKLECDLLPYLARMYTRGLKVDMEYAARVLSDDASQPDSIVNRINKAKEQFEPGFNVRSPKEVEALYRANGIDKFDLTASGKPSFTEKWLSSNEIGEAILSVRQLEKARDSFIMPLVNNFNGRIHPVLNQSKSDEYGVAGARLSCSSPNMQAFPKRNEAVGKTVRPLIMPDFGLIYEDDFQQQEPRFFTHYSKEPALIEGYRNGTMDMHDRAAEVLGLDRKIAKRLGMGMLTMMSQKTLAMHMGFGSSPEAVAKARAMHHAFLEDAFPAIGEFQQAVVSVFRKRGFVKDILGRRAYCLDPKFAYQGVSRVIQNSGGEHMKTGLLRINQYEDAYPDEFQVLMSIHDSSIFQTDQDKHAAEAKRLLENVAVEFELLVPIPVDEGKGRNWSEASYGA